MAQVNRATRNNVFGLLPPQSVIPSMSAPVFSTPHSSAPYAREPREDYNPGWRTKPK